VHPFESPHLDTKRLILTWPTESQIIGFYETIKGTAMFDTILWEGPESEVELMEWWEGNRKRDPNDLSLRLSLAIIERESSRCIGGIGLNPKSDDPATVTISYTMAPISQGKGYATEAVQGLVDEAFNSRGAQRVLGPVFVGNGASKRVLEKTGFQLDAIRPKALEKRGVWIDLWELSLTKVDWEENVRSRHG